MNPAPASRTLYLDCFSGISGDMFLAALLHAGLDQDLLRRDLEGLGLEGVQVQVSQGQEQGIACCRLRVEAPAAPPLRHLPDLLAILEQSPLDAGIKDQGAAIFQRLARAEATVHGLDINQVHFHEIGAVDTIIDVVGVLCGLHHLGVRQVIASPLPWGRGFVDCAHGRLPLPAPAVCELLRDIPVQGIETEHELVTPTGAALVTELASGFGPLPPMRIIQTGYGGGSFQGRTGLPNLLRVHLGTREDVTEAQEVEVIETQLDDWSGEGLPHLNDLLFDAGALDVSVSPLLMKKGRPGQLLRVLAPPAAAHTLKELILSQTTAIGLRFRREQRLTLPRRPVTISTPWGKITAKEVQTPRGPVIHPEYEACRALAEQSGQPLLQIYRAVHAAGVKDHG